MNDDLIFGKNLTQRLVALEVEDDQIEIFTEEKDGTIKSQWHKNNFWILCHSRPDESWIRMKGDLHYKWGKQYSTRKDFMRARQSMKHTHDIFSVYDAKEAAMLNYGFTYHKGMTIDEVSILSFDIETTGLDPKSKDAKVLLISNTFRKNGKIEKKLFAYNDYSSDGDFFDAWCGWVRNKNPSILVGHNIFSYDLPYLDVSASRAGTSLNLGRDGSKIKWDQYTSKFRKDQTMDLEYTRAHIYGRNIIDTMFLAIKYDVVEKKYASYGLKPIIKVEGLEKPGRVFYDAGLIRKNYNNPVEWEKIKNYCSDDSDDSLALYDLIAPAVFLSAQMISKPYQTIGYSASGSQINSMMIRSYLQEAHSIPKADEVTIFSGALSWGNPGIWKNCEKIDIKSMYPSIMLQYDVHSKKKDPKGNMLNLLKILIQERFKNKDLAKKTGNKYYTDLEQSMKILLNSFYGFMSTKGLNFNYPEGAAFVTNKGRELLNETILWATGKKYEEWNKTKDGAEDSTTCITLPS